MSLNGMLYDSICLEDVLVIRNAIVSNVYIIFHLQFLSANVGLTTMYRIRLMYSQPNTYSL